MAVHSRLINWLQAMVQQYQSNILQSQVVGEAVDRRLVLVDPVVAEPENLDQHPEPLVLQTQAVAVAAQRLTAAQAALERSSSSGGSSNGSLR